jgi:hypothetical protein
MKSYENKIRDFSILLGYIRIAMKMDSYSDVSDKYGQISDVLSSWVKDYILHKNFDSITHEESIQIYKMIDCIREDKLFNKNIGSEKDLSDQILIWYEIVIKDVNEERGNQNGKR